MQAAEWHRVRDLFDTFVELRPADRDRRLAALALEPALAKELHGLLAAADASGDFLERPATIAVLEAANDQDYRSLPPDARIGAFRVESLIGRGGQGEVYRAIRADGHFEQIVALKLLRPEAVRQAERFRTERQILADLDHPGIARLIDGGTTPDGRPYLAMEFVEGRSITAHCEAEELALGDRLRLVQDVAEAVAHAHRHLVIHRDLKPGNVLVTPDGAIKLLDFGIARILEEDDAAMTTEALLTPDYAAPEQFEGTRPTTATDVYALGALLFELLTGRPPWLRTGAFPVAARLLGTEPPRASRSLRGATERLLDPAEIEGDLDAIVAKAMRTRPEDRYESALAFAQDIERHLSFRPVEAREGDAAYRVRRFARRHRGPLAAGAVTLCSIAAGAIAYAVQSRRTETERAVAREEAGRTNAVRDYLMLMLRTAGEDGGPSFGTAKQVLDGTAAQLRRESQAPQRPLLRVLGELYAEMDDYEQAAALWEQEAVLADEAADAMGLARARQMMALLAVRQGQLDPADRLLAAAERVWARDPRRFARERAEAAGIEAALLRERGRRPEGLARLREAKRQTDALLGPGNPESCAIQHNIGVHLSESGAFQEADEAFAEMARLLAERGRERSILDIALATNRAGIAFRAGRTEEAEAMWRDAMALRRSLYGPSAGLAAIQMNLGRMMLVQGRHEEALALLGQATEMARAFAGPDSTIAIMARQSLALALCLQDRLEEADEEIEQTLAVSARVFGQDHIYTALALTVRSQLRLFGGDGTAAQVDLDGARAILLRSGEAGRAHLGELDLLQGMLDDIAAANAEAQSVSESSR